MIITVKLNQGRGDVVQDEQSKDDTLRKQVRMPLIYRIIQIIKGHKLNQTQAAKLLDLDQPRVSDLMTGKYEKFSIETLLIILNKLDKCVEIHIKPKYDERMAARTCVYDLSNSDWEGGENE